MGADTVEVFEMMKRRPTSKRQAIRKPKIHHKQLHEDSPLCGAFISNDIMMQRTTVGWVAVTCKACQKLKDKQ